MASLFGLEVSRDRHSRCIVRDVRRGSVAAALGVEKGWSVIAVERPNGTPIALSNFLDPSSMMQEDVICTFEGGGQRRLRMRLTLRVPKDAGESSERAGAHSSEFLPATPQVRRADREVPRRFSLSPSRGSPAQNKVGRSASESPHRRVGLFGAITDFFRAPIESIQRDSPEATFACRRVWRGWKAVCLDDTIIMRKQYAYTCVEHFNALKRDFRQARIANCFCIWMMRTRRRKKCLLGSLRLLRLVILNAQGRALAGWSSVTKTSKQSGASLSAPDTCRAYPHAASFPTSGARANRPHSQKHDRLDSASRKSAGSWLFGLFGGRPATAPEGEHNIQETTLVRAPGFPEHVRAYWPDLDVESYTVALPSHTNSPQPHEKLTRQLDARDRGTRPGGALTCTDDTQAALAQLREHLKRAEAVNQLLVSSRDRMRRFAVCQGWIKISRDPLFVTGQKMATKLLEQNGWQPSRALAAFTCEFVGAASAKNSDMRLARRAYLSWCAVSLSKRLQRITVLQLRRKRLLKARRAILRRWQQTSIWQRTLVNISALIRLKFRCYLLRSALHRWRRAAQEHLNTYDDDSAGPESPGDRISVGLSAAAAIGGLLIGRERFDSLLSRFSPSPSPQPPCSDPPPGPSRRAATLSPHPVPAVWEEWGQSGWSMSPSSRPRSLRAWSEELPRMEADAEASAAKGATGRAFNGRRVQRRTP